jgi:hypothetical protein
VGYSVLADLVLILHLAFIFFIVLGGILVARWPRMVWAHLPAAFWGVLIELAGWICPLTPLENDLRRRAGQSAYSESFVEHYLMPVIYPEELTRNVQLLLAFAVFAWNAAIYAWVLRRRRTR